MVTGTLTKNGNDGRAASIGSEDKSVRKVSPRLRVVITCVTFETVKVVKPIKELRAERVYILHYDSGSKAKVNVYSEFYHEVVRQLLEYGLEEEDIIERNVKVFRFKDVMSELVAIMAKERKNGNEVYVNVSAGSMEFAAAATVAAMMVKGVKPVTVHTREYTVSGDEKVRKTYSVGGKLIGQCLEVAEPVELPTFHIDMPPRDLVIGLRELRNRKDKKQTTKYSVIIQAIKDAGAWTYDPEKEAKFKAADPRRGERVMQAEKMYYSRHYIDGWIRRGWVDGKAGRGRDLVITDSGENVADVFYLE
jgi:hypothetical protein